MVCFHVFGFFAIAMCLAACVCVSADGAETEQDKAQKAVEAVAALAQTELDSAKANFKRANSILTRVQSNKRSAEYAISQVKDVPNGNANAEAIATEVKTTASEVIAQYTAAHKAAADAVSKMRDMVNKATALVAQANIDTDLESESSSDYKKVNNQVSQVTTNVGTFQTEMQQEVKILDPAGTLEYKMSGLVDKVKVGKYHFSVILSVSKIDTVLKKADVDIGTTETKRDEVNNTLEEMRESSQNAPQKLTNYVNKMILDAEGALVTASEAVQDAKKVQKEMMKIKTDAEASLAKFDGETNPQKVEQEVGKTKRYAAEIEKKVPGIASALQLAEITAKNAETRKTSFIIVLSSGDTQPSVEDNKITKKPGEPLKDGEKALVKKEEAPSSTTNTESNTQGIVQTVSKSNNEPSGEETNNSEQALNSATDSPQNGLKVQSTMLNAEKKVIETSEKSVKQASEKLAVDKKKLPKVTYLNTMKKKLQNSTKNGIQIPLVDVNSSAVGVLSDSSITVSVPLLVALIASAVMH